MPGRQRAIERSVPPRDIGVESWALAMDDIRADYRRGSTEKLAAIARSIERLEKHGRPDTLDELRRRFHGLAGSGLTYGFPGVSVAGRRGEDLCRAVARDGGPPPAETLAAWRRLLEALRREFDGETAPTARA